MVAEGFNPRIGPALKTSLKGWPTVSRHSVAKCAELP